ncbi:MAG: superoxide dismutase family protein [Betaproteobacteria bacterium]|nr:superoxide dismutase family protein [Betaproteobacteria bacterium]
MKTAFAAVAATILLTACETVPTDTPLVASAALQPTKGSKTFGEATFEQVGDKVLVVAFLQNLKPGQEHGFHIHEVGDCSSGDGMSTKGHFNPFNKPHAHYGSAERHAGDLPNLKADKKGFANIRIELDQITLRPGPGNIVGRGVIVHTDPDDYKSQPTGNAGARIACGVIQLH